MSPGTANNLQQQIIELANMFLIISLLFIAVLAVYVIWHMRMKKMREYHRDRRHRETMLGEKLNLTAVLPDLSKDEMRKIAINEKARQEDEQIDLENYEGLPLKPIVYFDPEKDAVADYEPPVEPKIIRSFLSNEPLPRVDAPEENGEKKEEGENMDGGETADDVESLWGSVEVWEKAEGDEG